MMSEKSLIVDVLAALILGAILIIVCFGPGLLLPKSDFLTQPVHKASVRKLEAPDIFYTCFGFYDVEERLVGGNCVRDLYR